MSGVRGVLTEALREVLDDSALMRVGRSIGDLVSAAVIGDVVDALLALPGVAVVQLPEPDLIQGEKRWNDGNVWTGAPGKVRAYLGDARMTSGEARELAADLLAAAAVAEGLGVDGE